MPKELPLPLEQTTPALRAQAKMEHALVEAAREAMEGLSMQDKYAAGEGLMARMRDLLDGVGMFELNPE